jgi:hypothetical protein
MHSGRLSIEEWVLIRVEERLDRKSCSVCAEKNISEGEEMRYVFEKADSGKISEKQAQRTPSLHEHNSMS